jgi:hypothetical protein
VKALTTIFLGIGKNFVVFKVHGDQTNAKEKVYLFIQTARCSLAPSIRTKFAAKEFSSMIKLVISFCIMGIGKII